MSANLQQRRTFVATAPNFLATPPNRNEMGKIILSANTAQRGVYIGVADSVPAAPGAPVNPAWYKIDGGSSTNVSFAIAENPLGNDIVDDINTFIFSGQPADLTDATNPGVLFCATGYNIYFTFAREGATYLWTGALNVNIGNADATTPAPRPTPGTPYYVAPTTPAATEPWEEVLDLSTLLSFGGNPDAVVQNPQAGVAQSITPGSGGDVGFALKQAAGGQTANLLEIGLNTEFNANGFLSMSQGSGGAGNALRLDDWTDAAGDNPSFLMRTNGGFDMIEMTTLLDPLGDGINRGVFRGTSIINSLIIENAILDGGIAS